MLNSLCALKFGLGWAHDVFKFTCHMLMHFHTYIPSFLFILILIVLVLFFMSLFLPLSFFRLVASWHLNESPLCPKTLCVLGHLLPLTLHLLLYGSMMIKPKRTFQRTFVDEAFIWNATSFCQTFLTLACPLSFIVGVGSHFVTSWSIVPPWSYRIFTPICTKSILLYLISSLAFEVHAS